MATAIDIVMLICLLHMYACCAVSAAFVLEDELGRDRIGMTVGLSLVWPASIAALLIIWAVRILLWLFTPIPPRIPVAVVRRRK